MSICNQFELASGAKINQGKNEAMFFGNQLDRSFIPFTVARNYLGIWTIKKWSVCLVLETLQEKETVSPVAWFPEQTVKAIGQNASSPELSNKHQDSTWLVVRRAVVVRTCSTSDYKGPMSDLTQISSLCYRTCTGSSVQAGTVLQAN
eukprot:g45343.t1